MIRILKQLLKRQGDEQPQDAGEADKKTLLKKRNMCC